MRNTTLTALTLQFLLVVCQAETAPAEPTHNRTGDGAERSARGWPAGEVKRRIC